MKKLLIYLKDYKKECFCAPLFKLLEAIFELIVPLVVARIIDEGIGGNDNQVIIRNGLLMIALGVIGMLSAFTAQYFSAKAATGFGTQLRHSLFAHIQSLSYTEMDTIGISTLITRMTSDINQTQNCVNMVLRLFMRSPFIVFGAMIMAFTVNVKAALIFVVAIPLLSVVVFGIILSTIPMYKKVQNKLDQVTGVTRENLNGARVIRAFHKEQDEIKNFTDNTQELTVLQMKAGRVSALMNPITLIIVDGAICALLYQGAFQVNTGILTQGQVIALVNYMSQILVELVKLANLIVTITKAVACGNRIEAVLSTQSSMVEKENAIRKSTVETDEMVRFEQVSLVYQNAGSASISDIDFVAKKGQTIGVIGGTGSGKSSLLNLIPRFYDATMGNVYVDGVNVKDYQIDALRSMIGVVPQKAVLVKGTIRSNLLWGNENATEEELKEALRISQALEFVEKKEGKMDALVSQNGKNLSGGQRQRLTIARALVKKPRILILDDSASALDFATDAALRKAIKEMDGDATVFIVSQRASSVRYADQIICLDDGEIVGIGSHEKLLSECEVYQEIFYSQYEKTEGGVVNA